MNILFVCAGNSVRSPMAEGWARHLAGNGFNIKSAGIRPGGIHPLAVLIMQQVNIDISRHKSRRLSDDLIDWADHIVTLADSVKPYIDDIPDSVIHHHWSIPNPDAVVGDDLSLTEAYARARDQIKRRVARLLEDLGGENT